MREQWKGVSKIIYSEVYYWEDESIHDMYPETLRELADDIEVSGALSMGTEVDAVLVERVLKDYIETIKESEEDDLHTRATIKLLERALCVVQKEMENERG